MSAKARCISVTGAKFAAMKAYCQEKGISMRRLVEDSVEDHLTAFEKQREAREKQAEILFDTHPHDETRDMEHDS